MQRLQPRCPGRPPHLVEKIEGVNEAGLNSFGVSRYHRRTRPAEHRTSCSLWRAICSAARGTDQEGFAERFVGDLTGSDLLTCHCTRMAFKVGDQVKWKSHGGEAQGTVVRVVHEDGEVSGFQYRASREDPRYIVELKDGQRAAHTEAALSKT